jgi:L-lactate dehydrogenase complex protein LldE
MRVSLFITCLAEMIYQDVAKDVVEVLERLGCEVHFPKGQICCGQPAYNSGYRQDAQKAAKQMIRAFENSVYIVTPSGSCAAMFKEYPALFKEDPVWQKRAQLVADKTHEFTQFIVNVLRIEDVGAVYPGKAAYHTSCHMIRLLQETEAPFKLLKNVKGLELLPLANSYDCCGFGGTFAIKMAPISERMVDEKIRHVEHSTAKLLIGADNGCLMNIQGRIDRQGKPIEVKHIAQILNSRVEGRA